MPQGHDPYHRSAPRDEDPVAARYAAEAKEGQKPRDGAHRPVAEEARARRWQREWDAAMDPGKPQPAVDPTEAFLSAIQPIDREAHERHLAHVRRLDAQAAAVVSEEPASA